MSDRMFYVLPQIHVRDNGGEKSRFSHRGTHARKISQDTIRAMRRDWAGTVTLQAIAKKYELSIAYVRRVVCEGIRDEEREVFLRRKAK